MGFLAPRDRLPCGEELAPACGIILEITQGSLWPEAHEERLGWGVWEFSPAKQQTRMESLHSRETSLGFLGSAQTCLCLESKLEGREEAS